jgi:hypothetical protein
MEQFASARRWRFRIYRISKHEGAVIGGADVFAGNDAQSCVDIHGLDGSRGVAIEK